MFRFKSLGARFLVTLLIPVCILMISGGLLSFVFTRDAMLAQWNEGAILKLERAAHVMEMHLMMPLTLLDSLLDAQPLLSPDEILAFLNAQKGVIRAEYQGAEFQMDHRRGGRNKRRQLRRSGITGISSPRFDAAEGKETLTISVELQDKSQSPAGSLNILMGLDYLLEDVVRLGWWQSEMACIVDSQGRYIAHTNIAMAGRRHLGDRGDPFETAILSRMKDQDRGTVGSGERPPERIAGFYKLDQAPWAIVIYARGRTVLAPILRYRNGFALGILVLSGIILALIRYQTRRVSRSIRQLSDRALRIGKGAYGDPIPVRGKDEIASLVTSFNAMAKGLEERDYIRNTFGRYVDPEFARRLLAGSEAAALGGKRREVAILMSDIREFTSFSEQLSPEETLLVLNLYFSGMIRLIQEQGGIIVDFVGDALLVFFDSLDQSPDEATARAFACALQMQKEMGSFNKEVGRRGLPGFDMGIGLHCGPVVVGNIGSDSRTKYGIVGSAVNLTARIQARAAKGEILATAPACEKLGESVRVLSSSTLALKGIDQPVEVFSLTGKNTGGSGE